MNNKIQVHSLTQIVTNLTKKKVKVMPAQQMNGIDSMLEAKLNPTKFELKLIELPQTEEQIREVENNHTVPNSH